jgi:hypothetical protein
MNKFKLRHSLKIYSGIFIIYVVLMIGLGLLAGLTNNGGSMKDILLVLTVIFFLYFAFLYFLNSRYQIFLENAEITMRAASLSADPKAPTSIKISDITLIKREVSDVHTTVKLKRPFQRISIYDKSDNKFIDISLKHFLMQDIRKLMKLIKEKRPDLDVPLAN